MLPYVSNTEKTDTFHLFLNKKQPSQGKSDKATFM